MRGPRLFALIWIVALCRAGLAQKVQFAPADQTAIVQRMKIIPEANQDRMVELKKLFAEAGCNGSALTEQLVEGMEIPNIACQLHGASNDTIVVVAHYE